MVGWHHQLDGREFEQAPGVGDGQGILVGCSLWGCKELEMTEHSSGIFNVKVTQKNDEQKFKSLHLYQNFVSDVQFLSRL